MLHPSTDSAPRAGRRRLVALTAAGVAAGVLVFAASAAPPPQFAYRGVSPGFGATCAITVGGAARCWGENGAGQLGNRTPKLLSTPAPVTVLGLGSGVTAVSVGASFACAVQRGVAKCWGNVRNIGEPGTGSTRSLRPVTVSGLASGVKALDTGFNHACAITGAGGVRCWGRGVLGNGARTLESATPVEVAGLSSGVVAVSAGGGSCALTGAGGVKCWGAPVLGDGSKVIAGILTPVDVAGLTSGVQAVSVGFEHACALTSAGGVKCWGKNGYRQLGTSEVYAALTPVDVPGLTSGVTAIAAGQFHTCALLTGGTVKCWGSNGRGELGTGKESGAVITPASVVGLGAGVRAIGAGSYYTCAIDRAGITKCWGDNGASQQAGIALPFQVSFSAKPLPVYGQSATRGQGPTRTSGSASFLSPTGNLSCAMSDRPGRVSVYCRSLRRPHSVTMNGSGQLAICRGARCIRDAAEGATALGYGGRMVVGRFACRSQFSGVTCTVAGKGFVINKDQVRRVG